MRSSRLRQRGMTLIEMMVALAVMGMVAVLVYGVMDSLSRGKKAEGMRSERAHAGREALARIVRDLSSAYLSMHVPLNLALVTQKTAFVGRSSSPYDRIDFTAFAHQRTTRDAKESDQCEVGYFVVADPNVDGKMDLVRREQTPIDIDPLKGGIVNVIAEDVAEFDVRFLEPMTGQWLETWDSTQIMGQPNRIPLEVDIRLSLNGVGDGPKFVYATKVFLPMQQPLSFGIPRE